MATLWRVRLFSASLNNLNNLTSSTPTADSVPNSRKVTLLDQHVLAIGFILDLAMRRSIS